MPKRAGIVLSIMGAVLILSALLLFMRNDREAEEAGRQADAALDQLQAMMESMDQTGSAGNAGAQTGDGREGLHGSGAEDPASDPTGAEDLTSGGTAEGLTGEPAPPEDNYLLLDPEDLPEEMPILWVGGYDYIGYLEIPALQLELPVMGDWDYDRLKIAPCRQFGSAGTRDLVIAGHNYEQFFARLGSLRTGDTVRFTDVEGRRITYTVHRVESLSPEAVEAVQYSGYDLVLYTCNESATTRIAAFCQMVELHVLAGDSESTTTAPFDTEGGQAHD